MRVTNTALKNVLGFFCYSDNYFCVEPWKTDTIFSLLNLKQKRAHHEYNDDH